MRSLRQFCDLTFNAASADSGISRSVLENIEYRSNMNFHSYMQLHLFYMSYLQYNFDHALLNKSILDCVSTNQNLVLLEVSDDELEQYREKGEVLMEKEE